VWPRGWVEVYLYSSMTAALEGGEWSAARPGRILPLVPILQEAGWVPVPVWTGGKSRPHRDSIHGSSSPGSSVAIPTELPGPQNVNEEKLKQLYLNILNNLIYARVTDNLNLFILWRWPCADLEKLLDMKCASIFSLQPFFLKHFWF